MIPTPHITAKLGDFAKTVLMPGDPKRSCYIAKNFLDKAELINDVRGVQGYTGWYKGHRVSVMASGMGMPSMAIYAHELFNFYEVENILRVGSAGATSPDINLYDIVIGTEAFTKSNIVESLGFKKGYIPQANEELVSSFLEFAKQKSIDIKAGRIFSSDAFYREDILLPYFIDNKILAVEMEAAALYMNAYKAKKKALTICTISDSLITLDSMDAYARERTFDKMIELTLDFTCSI